MELLRSQMSSLQMLFLEISDILLHYWTRYSPLTLQDYGVLDYMETIKDGFYDVYCKNAETKEMPSLIDLETNTEGSDFEVVVVNCKIDPGLVELMDVAQCIAIDFPATEINLLVQRLAELVTGQMGGPVRDANVLKARWMERSSELRTSRHTTVLPIGALQIGLTRHRALLFKVRTG